MLLFVGAAYAVTVRGDDIGEAARYYLEARPALAREDCSGLVEAIHSLAGHPIDGSVHMMWAEAEAEGRVHDDARVGDVVFFDDTFDSDRDGRANDDLTHVAVVMRVEPDGTIVMVHRAKTAGIEEIHMDLSAPDHYKDGEHVRNDYLAVRGWSNETGGRLTGQLFHGFASFADDGGVPSSAFVHPTYAAAVAKLDRVDRPRKVVDDPFVKTVTSGARLRLSDLDDIPCGEVGLLRDAVYARHGYVFHDDARNAPFRGRSWYAAEAGLDSTAAARALTPKDRYNLDLLEALASVCDP